MIINRIVIIILITFYPYLYMFNSKIVACLTGGLFLPFVQWWQPLCPRSQGWEECPLSSSPTYPLVLPQAQVSSPCHPREPWGRSLRNFYVGLDRRRSRTLWPAPWRSSRLHEQHRYRHIDKPSYVNMPRNIDNSEWLFNGIYFDSAS